MEDENKTQPKLTLMEEVLLLGLKDKQVTTNSHYKCGERGRATEKEGVQPWTGIRLFCQ